MMKEKQKTNWVLTIVLILGTVTVFFPLYMAAIIAFKKPSEMTNDVAGALSFPKQWAGSCHEYHHLYFRSADCPGGSL